MKLVKIKLLTSELTFLFSRGHSEEVNAGEWG